jgi:ribosomal protein RSM22 (predicted rRNA methylase)
MELPRILREAIDQALDGISTSELAESAAALSQRYRSEMRDGRLHVANDRAARAYIAARMPATFAAIRAAMESAAELLPDFTPRSLLDAGAGPGTAMWAAVDCWPDIADAVLLEASSAMRAWGERFSALAPIERVVWHSDDVGRGIANPSPRDLVTLGYVLGELAPAARAPLVARLWSLTTGMLLIVEPGTPTGWARILDARATLIAAGAHLVAPCPHALACPLTEPDWCHFVRRVARSRLHRLAKTAEVPWEDEKFIYIAASRVSANAVRARVIGPPKIGSGRVTLELCRNDGEATEHLVTRRDGDDFRLARRAEWGDALP